MPLNYANAFAAPVAKGDRDVISQSIAQLGQYAYDMDTGFGRPTMTFWFSPNLRHRLSVVDEKTEKTLADSSYRSLDELIAAVVATMGHDWKAIRQIPVN